ncbi:hypothetical protein GJ744_002698 [Endocarpon pusillum]|uniref:beta-glucosidase n=1 Tax=Endocarpon pusillum TaxID=364733 RepID=A0A8H7AVP4_9EURO|nr:hypothetical protein GJ744_002698 [Endocarpon pusillum]
MLVRILTPYFYLGQHQGYPSVDHSPAVLNTLYSLQHSHAELIRTLAPKNIGVFGNDAADTVNGQYSFQDEDTCALPIGGGSEVCLVFLKTYVSKSYDRTSYDVDANGNSMRDQHHALGDNENVTAIIAAHFPGQEIGNSVVDVLYCAVNPSGHLPYTTVSNASDYSTSVANFSGTNDTNGWQSNYAEGFLIDYRCFDYANVTPRYEFGFGLSYTTFSLDDLTITPLLDNNISSLPAPVSGPNPPGGNPYLYTTVLAATVTVNNTGTVPVSAVRNSTSCQCSPDFRPVHHRRLCADSKRWVLPPNGTARVEFVVTRRDVSF